MVFDLLVIHLKKIKNRSKIFFENRIITMLLFMINRYRRLGNNKILLLLNGKAKYICWRELNKIQSKI